MGILRNHNINQQLLIGSPLGENGVVVDVVGNTAVIDSTGGIIFIHSRNFGEIKSKLNNLGINNIKSNYQIRLVCDERWNDFKGLCFQSKLIGINFDILENHLHKSYWTGPIKECSIFDLDIRCTQFDIINYTMDNEIGFYLSKINTSSLIINSSNTICFYGKVFTNEFIQVGSFLNEDYQEKIESGLERSLGLGNLKTNYIFLRNELRTKRFKKDISNEKGKWTKIKGSNFYFNDEFCADH